MSTTINLTNPDEILALLHNVVAGTGTAIAAAEAVEAPDVNTVHGLLVDVLRTEQAIAIALTSLVLVATRKVQPAHVVPLIRPGS